MKVDVIVYATGTSMNQPGDESETGQRTIHK